MTLADIVVRNPRASSARTSTNFSRSSVGGYTLFRALLLSSQKAQCVTRARNELSPLLGRHQRRAEMDYEPWLRGLVIGLSKRASNDLLEK